MIGILKNNLARLASRKAATGIALLLTAASMLLAVYFTPRQAPQARVALVMTRQTALPSSPYLKCTRVASVPPKADLLLNKYDAFVVDRGNGRYAIVTFKNSAFKQMLLAALRH
jgi:ABC-2 type transport system permease protein